MAKKEEVSKKVSEAAKETSEKVEKSWGKFLGFLDPLTNKIGEFVVDSGKVIVTLSILIGLISVLIGGFADMGNVGFFTGLSNIFHNAITVIMSGLTILVLIAIKENTDK